MPTTTHFHRLTLAAPKLTLTSAQKVVGERRWHVGKTGDLSFLLTIETDEAAKDVKDAATEEIVTVTPDAPLKLADHQTVVGERRNELLGGEPALLVPVRTVLG